MSSRVFVLCEQALQGVCHNPSKQPQRIILKIVKDDGVELSFVFDTEMDSDILRGMGYYGMRAIASRTGKAAMFSAKDDPCGKEFNDPGHDDGLTLLQGLKTLFGKG